MESSEVGERVGVEKGGWTCSTDHVPITNLWMSPNSKITKFQYYAIKYRLTVSPKMEADIDLKAMSVL